MTGTYTCEYRWVLTEWRHGGVQVNSESLRDVLVQLQSASLARDDFAYINTQYVILHIRCDTIDYINVRPKADE